MFQDRRMVEMCEGDERNEEGQRVQLLTGLSKFCTQGWMAGVSAAVGPSATEWNRHRM